MPDLIEPHVRVHESFLTAVEESLADGRVLSEDSMIARWIRQYADRWHTEVGFAEFVDHLHADSRPDAPRLSQHVPQSTWWMVEDDVYLGRISCRHVLNDWLLEYGGHIGYEVRPSVRRRGHATAMLRAVLPHAHALGIDPALVTCDETNVASRKVIESAGGELEDVRGVKRRYWVPTAP